jgi:hypothetical protein
MRKDRHDPGSSSNHGRRLGRFGELLRARYPGTPDAVHVDEEIRALT